MNNSNSNKNNNNSKINYINLCNNKINSNNHPIIFPMNKNYNGHFLIIDKINILKINNNNYKSQIFNQHKLIKFTVAIHT